MPQYQDQTLSSQREKKPPMQHRPYNSLRDDDRDDSDGGYESTSEDSDEVGPAGASVIINNGLEMYRGRLEAKLHRYRGAIERQSPSPSPFTPRVPIASDTSFNPFTTVVEDEIPGTTEIGAQQTQWELITSNILNSRYRYGRTPRSHNMSQESLASLFTERKAAATTAYLSPDMRLFTSIPLYDHQECEAFITDHPNVLDTNTHDLQDAARMSIEYDLLDQARRIVDRLTIIALSRNHNSHVEYIHGLRESVQTSEHHREECERLFAALTKQVELSPKQSLSNTMTILPGHRIHQHPLPSRKSLGESFWVRQDAAYFFRRGRVFKILWHQPGGGLNGKIDASNFKPGAYGELIYTTLRYMLVIKSRDGYSLCCPVSTYGGNGLTKKGFSEAQLMAHSIIYSAASKPKRVIGEPQLSKDPVPVVMADGVEELNSATRIHFGKSYTVEWNVKVMNIGMVTEQYHHKIVAHFLSEMV